jgi:hypothetical protein
MRRRDKPLDIYKKLQIVRSMEELILDEEAAASIAPEKTGDSENLKSVNRLTLFFFVASPGDL